MSRRPIGKPIAISSYRQDLQAAMRQFLPHTGLPLLCGQNQKLRWTPRLLVMQAVLMAWSVAATLSDRFTESRACLVQMFGSRRRPGQSCEGFVAALAKLSEALLEGLCQYWRQCVQELAGDGWLVGPWVLFGADGSKFDCPRTRANEQAFGTSGKNNSGPQQLLTCLFHVGSGLPWAWRRGGVRGSSERQHLREMLPLLPEDALLLADAGFSGYDLLREILQGERQFLMRVGANVRLLKKLGYYLEERDGIVYLWPDAKQGRDSHRHLPKDLKKVCPPLVLRLIQLVDGRGRRMALLSSVLSQQALSDPMAAQIYRLRWGIELMWRSLKQTLRHAKLLSHCPQNASVELDWAMAGLWMLGLLAVSRMRQSGQSLHAYSVASVLRALRGAMNGRAGRRGRRVSLARQLMAAVKDQYVRHGSKKARHYPHKRPQRPPEMPRARKATRAKVKLAQRLRDAERPNTLAA